MKTMTWITLTSVSLALAPLACEQRQREERQERVEEPAEELGEEIDEEIDEPEVDPDERQREEIFE